MAIAPPLNATLDEDEDEEIAPPLNAVPDEDIAPPLNATLDKEIVPPLNATPDEDITPPLNATPDEDEVPGTFGEEVIVPPRTETTQPTRTPRAGPAVPRTLGSLQTDTPSDPNAPTTALRGRSTPVLTPEQVAIRKFHDSVIERVGADIDKFNEEFKLTERLEILLGRGITRRMAGELLGSIVTMREELNQLRNNPPEDVMGLGMGLAGADVEIQVNQRIIDIETQLAKVENEYMSVVDAVMNPVVMDKDNNPVPVRDSPLMLALGEAQANGDTKLVNRLLGEFWLESMTETSLISVAQAGPALILVPGGLALAGFVAGGVKLARGAFVIGSGDVAFDTEARAAISEKLQELGVDITDIKAIEGALRDPETIKVLRTFAKRRGYGVAMWGMLSAYVAAKVISPPGLTRKFAQAFYRPTSSEKFARQAFNLPVQIAQQIGSEAAGEFTAQVAAGQKINTLDIKLEAMGAGSQISESVVFRLASKFGGKVTDYNNVGKVLDAFINNPEMTAEEAIEALREVAANGMSRNEAVAMLNAIPGLNLDVDTVLDDDLHTTVATSPTSFRKDPIRKKAVETRLYRDTSGNLKTGKEIIESAEGSGTVFWGTDEDTTGGSVGTLEGKIALIEDLISSKESSLAGLKAQGTATSTTNPLVDEIETLKDRVQQIKRDKLKMDKLRPKMQELLQEMVRLFMPDQDILVIENSHIADTLTSVRKGGSSGTAIHNGKVTRVMYINTSALLDPGLQPTPGRKRGRGFATLLSIMGHEFGHLMAMTWFNKLPPEIREALQAEHRRWLAKVLKDKGKDTLLMDILKTKSIQYELTDLNAGKGTDVIIGDSTLKDYHLSFTEFVADLMARQLIKKDGIIVAPLTKKYLPILQRVMQRYFNMFKDQIFEADETYETFLIHLRGIARTNAMKEIKSQFSETELSLPAGDQAENVMRLLDSKHLDIDPEIKELVQANLDTYNKLMRYGVTLLQLGKENKHVKGLQQYIRAVHEHWVTKSNWNDATMQTMNAWRALGKTGDELGRFLLELTVASDDLGRALTNDEIQTLIQKKNINFGEKSQEAWTVYERVRGDLANALEEFYVIEKARLTKDWADVPTIMKAKLKELDILFGKLRNRNYFPLSRFGTWGITMKAEKAVTILGQSYAKGEVVHMELYENKRQRNKAIGTLQRKYGKNVKPVFFKVSEEMAPFTGLPAALMAQLKQNPALGLDAAQKKNMQDMIDVLSPTQAIAKRMLERKGTAGFSLDASRGFANYMLSMGSHIAKMRHVGEMDAALDSVKRSAEYLGERGIINDKRHDILSYLQRHQKYLLAPENEWGALRALAFHWFLGFNPKSALVNLTQVPLVAYPYLAARAVLTSHKAGVADAMAITALGKAGVDIGNIFRDRDSRLTVGEQEMLSILQAEGIIDESLATALAGQAHGDLIRRLMPQETAFSDNVNRVWQGFLGYSTLMFQAAEKYNRRVVALATFRLARKKNMSTQESIDEAREAIRTTQFEYARWNRAAFMRGKAGVLFVFMQYLQNVLYFVTRDPGKTRYMMMMLMAAGIQGLPGAEDLLDFLDFGGIQLRKWTKSDRDPRVNTREWLRQMINTLGYSPELIMHGAAAQSFGLSIPAVSDMLGTSIAGLSFESSISAGRVVPGWEALMKWLSGQPVGQVGTVEAAKDILGAPIALIINIIRLAKDGDPSAIRRLERMAPSILKGATKAFRTAMGGNEEGISTLKDRRGNKLIDFDMSDPTHIAELIGMALGAQPTRLMRVQEAKWDEREAEQFYAEMRRNLQIDFNYAMEERKKVGDRSAVKIAKDAIKQFNKIVPKGQQMLDFAGAYFQYKKNLLFEEQGIGRRMLNVPLRRDIQATHPVATEERLR